LNSGNGKAFFSSKCPDRLCGPLNLLLNGYQGYFLAVKQLGHGIEHSSPSIIEVKIE